MNIRIFSGTTEAEMVTQCADLIGPQTKVTEVRAVERINPK